MWRKGLWLVALAVFVVGFVTATAWVEERHAASAEVGWSPLYERRVLEALIPLTAQPTYAGAQQLTKDNWTCGWCEETSDNCHPTSEGATCEGLTCGDVAACTSDPAGCYTYGESICPPTEWVECTYDPAVCYTYDESICPPTEWVECTYDEIECHTFARAKCQLPTYEGETCARPTCGGPTCAGETCDGPTCFLTECDVLDYGDAPEGLGTNSDYATKLASDGARHIIDGVYYLGAREDAESDGQPDVFALGDDAEPYAKGDDEDGIWFSTTFNPGRQAVVIAAASQEGRLFAWVDYDMDGTWVESAEAVLPEGGDLAPGFNKVVLTVPETAVGAPLSYVRFRFTESDALLSAGEGENGEVEDYRVPICISFEGWVMTDQVLYRPGDPVEISFSVNEISQVTLVRHRADGTADVLWTSTVEAGWHRYPGSGTTLAAAGPEGTSTVEMIATSLQSGATVWLTTPYVVAQ